MATVPENAQRPNSGIRPQKAKKSKVSFVSRNNDDEATSKRENHESSKKEYESYSLS